MKICVISGNPKIDGTCQSVIDAAISGAREGGAEVDELRLCGAGIANCKVCGKGWGTCQSLKKCEFGGDGFDEAITRIKASDAIIVATPVYWGETSEALKSFMDRLRRCEMESIRGKQALLIASAGGSGNGILTCLEQMDRFCRHTGAIIFDHIGVNRWNKEYKKTAAKEAAFAIANGRKNGDR